MYRTLLALSLLALLVQDAGSADWPTTGVNAGRTGYTAEDLPAALSLRWTYQARHAPMPAWPRSDRQPYDRAALPVVAGRTLCFGSSADGTVRALDAITGKEHWSFFTGGPVRFAPTLWKDRAFAVSDDGHLYCLSLADGKLLWKRRGGPDGRMLLGNDRLISRWPARGGPVVVDGTVYFAAGIWPTDGIYLQAVDAMTGEPRWRNDQSGSIRMGQPHGGANADSGVSAQGYLVAAGDRLLVPTGRAVPAVFNRLDGKFEYFHLQANGHRGGTTTLAAGNLFLNGGALFDLATGTIQEPVGAGAFAATPDSVIRSARNEVAAWKIVDKEKVDRKGTPMKVKGLEKTWATTGVPGGVAVIVAGKTIVSAGGTSIALVDAASQKMVWSAEVDGTPHGLAVAGGRLYVSTDKGALHCFGAANADKGEVIRPAPPVSPYEENSPFAAAAKEILEKTGVTEGYCVDLGCGDGALVFELARRTKLQIYAMDADPEKVALARKKLDAAGLYGVRVTVHQGDPAKSPFPNSFANLVVSARSVATGAEVLPAREAERLARPFGGIVCAGKPGVIKKTVRGPLAGIGNWTHQYADPANSCCSADALVRGPLEMLWFRDSDLDMPQRHGRGPAPLFLDGRLFVEGLHGIRAVDAYNGRLLWEYPLKDILKPYNGEHLMGTAGTHSNFCVTADGVHVRTGSRCLRLDVATGKKLAEFEAPKHPDGKSGTWGYLAVENGTVFGSLVDRKHIVKWRYGKGDMSEQFTESALFFALDARTGQVKWTRPAKDSFRHNAIAIGNGRVFLIDRPVAEIDRIDPSKDKEHAKGELLALDARTGKVAWRTAEDVYGTLLALSVKHDVLVMGYQSTAFKLPSERGGQMTAFRAAEGKRLWDRKATTSTRPVLNDRIVYAAAGGNGVAWDLLTGEERRFPLSRSYGCGQMAGSAQLMVYRSATLGYCDLLSDGRTENYGGIRPGCWINAIPAGGLVLVPDASSGCQCSYLNQAWIVLAPRE